MVVTLWMLGLGALAALGYWLRRRWERSARTKELAQARHKSALKNAELDRLECLELETLLREGKTSRPSPSTGKPAARDGSAAG